MRPDPVQPRPLPRPLPPGAGAPGRLPFGPNSRYAGWSDEQLVAGYRQVMAALDLWCLQARRFQAVGVTTVLGGPCAHALLEALAGLGAELAALGTALRVRADEIRRAAEARAVA